MDKGDLILQAIEQMAAKFDRRFDSVEQRLDRVEQEVREIRTILTSHELRLTAIEARLEEQGRTLAALIPTRIAAVGHRPAAE